MGSLWLTGGTVSEQGLRFLRNIILTRILAPEAFGIMAIILAVNTFIESFTEVGIRQAVIQNKGSEEKSYLNTAWFLGLSRSIILYILAYLLAPLAAEFYENPQLVQFMRIAFLSIIFKGAMSPKSYIALKQLKFGKWVALFNGGGILGIIITCILALFLKNIWALILGFTSEAMFRFLISFILCPYKPSFVFNREHWITIFTYAKGMLGLPILTFIFMRTDIFVIGKMFSSKELGLYSMAAALAALPMHLGGVFDQLLLPVFSKMQHNFKELNKNLVKVTLIICSALFPSSIFIYLAGKEILSIVYGSEYGLMAIPFSIIFTTMVVRISSIPVASIYLAVGKPALHRKFTGIRAVLMVILIYPFIEWFGLIGAAAAGLFSMIVSYYFQIDQLHKLTEFKRRNYVYIFLYILSVNMLIILIYFVFSLHLSQTWLKSITYFNLIFGFISCGLAYVLILFTIRRFSLHLHKVY